MADQDTGPGAFRGFQSPKANFTIVPDELFDQLLALLSGPELKVLLYIIRRTYGFKRDSDTISLSQMLNGITTRDGRTLDHGVGLSKPTLLKALRSLRDKNVIRADRRQSAERGHEPTEYRLNVLDRPVNPEPPPPLVKDLYQGGGKGSLPSPWSKDLTTQETVEQETVEQETDFEPSKIRKAAPQEEQGSAAPATAPARRSSLQSVGDVLARRGQGRPGRGRQRPETLDEDYQRIQDYIADRAREFNDGAPLRSSTSRAYRLYQSSGLSIEAFVERIYQARALTQERTASITKTTRDPEHGIKRKSKMAYFFAVLEDVLGLAEPRPEATAKGTGGRPAAGKDEPDQDDPAGDDDPYAAYVQR